MDSWNMEESGLKPTSRIKAFVFRYISVAAKWIKAARRYVLNIYTTNKAYGHTVGVSIYLQHGLQQMKAEYWHAAEKSKPRL